ncbi:uncharacterized protein J3R85_019911 [Psidium guajava]|nr:uncharacterized protein J3R85_019911 [Psidium guajava]
MREYLWFASGVTVSAILFAALLFKDFFKRSAGPDTRGGITDVLYTSLVGAGIRTYRDDEGLRCGEEIGPKLLQAIQQSKISIPIFSKRYASSKWCLRELAHMVDCRKTRGQIIIPIFYDVVPSEVRMRSGVGDDETIRAWKAALKEASKIKGYDLQSMPNR